MTSEGTKAHASDPVVATEPRLDLDTIQVAEKRQEVGDKLRRFAVSRTSPSQWHQFGETVYMQGAAAENLAEALGIQITPADEQTCAIPGAFVELGDGHFMCVRRVKASFRGLHFTDHGDCDSFDDFLAKRRKELEERGATPDQVSSILKSDVSKKAFANAVSRAVSGLLGLRGMSWDDLHKLGLPRDGVKQTTFAKGSRGGKVAATSVADAAKASIGSKLAVASTIRRLTRREKFIDVLVGDTSATITVRLWTTKSPAPEWIAEGLEVFFPSIAVGEYQGAKQYSADTVEQRDAAGQQDDAPQQSNAAPAAAAAPKAAAPAAATRQSRQMTADEYEDARSKGQF